MKRTGQKGFTLLELIVVTGIIGALAGIAIPQYTRYRDNAEKASMVSDCRALYRSFVIFYLEHEEYPYAVDEPFKFALDTFSPLTDASKMGGFPFEIDIEQLRDKLAGRAAEKFDSPDDMGTNQEYYLVLPWAKDPSIKFVIASSDNVEYFDGTSVAGGNWIDGVFITQGGAIIGQ